MNYVALGIAYNIPDEIWTRRPYTCSNFSGKVAFSIEGTREVFSGNRFYPISMNTILECIESDTYWGITIFEVYRPINQPAVGDRALACMRSTCYPSPLQLAPYHASNNTPGAENFVTVLRKKAGPYMVRS